MNLTEIEFAVKALVLKSYDQDTFFFDLINIYNVPKTTVAKLRSGDTNAAKIFGDVLWKKHIYFRPASLRDDVAVVADQISVDPLIIKHKVRFIFVTNGKNVHVRDLKLNETCNVEFEKFDEKSDFMGPFAGFERHKIVSEHEADINAVKRLAKLYDALLIANPTWVNGNRSHELNLFMTRIVFCFFAEDTGIFPEPQMFTNFIQARTTDDGSDIADVLDRLFKTMNLEGGEGKSHLSTQEKKFPYVNGSLFEEAVEIPKFNRLARRLFIECGQDLDWKTINPDIFGSMIQTVAHSDTRSELGMHYTSIPNIMKVLNPLFLDELHEQFEKDNNDVLKLEDLLERLSKIRVFDPACGSGNFLIIAYKNLREIEIKIFQEILRISAKKPLKVTNISLNNFFGIDIVDFACETARLSLWIAQYQMDFMFNETFGGSQKHLPLGKISTIHRENSLRVNWEKICPKSLELETYICGNPPFIGSSMQNYEQKEDIKKLFSKFTKAYKNIDYIGCFFLKSALYSNNKTKIAFVSTNSICQGEQVSLLWPIIFDNKIDIFFSYLSFKWKNNAQANAGVTCVIIGICKSDSRYTPKIYDGLHFKIVKSISPYLIPGNNIIVSRRINSYSNFPLMIRGNMASDGGNLILSLDDKNSILKENDKFSSLIRRYYSAEDFLNGHERYCLWIDDKNLKLCDSSIILKKRINNVKKMRLESSASTTRDWSKYPHKFRQINQKNEPFLAIAGVSSERRKYLQIGLLGSYDIPSTQLYIVYSPPDYLLSLLSSRIHKIWTETIGGKLKTDIRYSNTLVYNTFPVPDLSNDQKKVLGDNSRSILKARAKHPGKTIAWLYNPETMPENLLQAHQGNDEYIETCIYGKKFKDDTQRLERLFEMYAAMKEKIDKPLFAVQPMKTVKAIK